MLYLKAEIRAITPDLSEFEGCKITKLSDKVIVETYGPPEEIFKTQYAAAKLGADIELRRCPDD